MIWLVTAYGAAVTIMYATTLLRADHRDHQTWIDGFNAGLTANQTNTHRNETGH